MRRRDFLPALAVSTAWTQTSAPVGQKGRLKQGVTRGVFGRGMSLEETCREAARLGCVGYDLIGPADWPTLKKYGLIPTMYPDGPGGSIRDALNRKENHAALEKSIDAAIGSAPPMACPILSRSRVTERACPTRRAPITASSS